MTTAYLEVRAGLPQALEGLSVQERILWSMVRVVSERGSESVSVDDVVERADVSLSGFYRLFESKEECLFAAYERVTNALVRHVTRGFERTGSWPLKIRRALGALLEAYAAEPEVARMATVELPVAVPEARRRYRDALRRLLPLFRAGRDYADNERLPADIELMAIGGAEAIIADEVVADRTEELPEMLPDILFAVLAPYLGPEAANAEVERTGSLSPP